MSSEYTEPTPTFAIITCSDTRTLETDTAGAALKEFIAERGWICLEHVVVEDERPFISGALLHAIEDLHADFVLTCGGSGLSPRDVTPEATIDVCKRNVPGIAEAMRAHSMRITPRAMLSRAVAGTRGTSLIINLPGSEKAAKENLSAIIGALEHAMHMIAAEGH